MVKEDYLFMTMGRRRNSAEFLHDMLVCAKNPIRKTRLMYKSNSSWLLLEKTLKIAVTAGFIEDVKLSNSRYKKRSNRGWKTTARGLEYIDSIRIHFKLFRDVEL